MADAIPANEWQRISVQPFGRKPIPSPQPLDLSPPTGDTEPQTFALASLTG